ncbi:hypothetical protein AB8880_08365 [Alphaproteobacteria bacterium LSUCC0684]
MIAVDQTQASLVMPAQQVLAPLPVAANSVPSLRQTGHGLEPVGMINPPYKDYSQRPASVISHPRFAPSTITSEQFMSARAMLSPGYIHQSAASKIARISNLYADQPRFSQQVDILA